MSFSVFRMLTLVSLVCVTLGLYREFSTLNGNIEITGRPLDLAIIGDGEFVVVDLYGKKSYTRCGRFATNSGGFIVQESTGKFLFSHITFPPEYGVIRVLPNGEVQYKSTISIDWISVGAIGVSKVEKSADGSNKTRVAVRLDEWRDTCLYQGALETPGSQRPLMVAFAICLVQLGILLMPRVKSLLKSA